MSSKRQPHPDPEINGEVLADIAISAQSDLDAGDEPVPSCPLHVCDAADSRACNRDVYDPVLCAPVVARIQPPRNSERVMCPGRGPAMHLAPGELRTEIQNARPGNPSLDRQATRIAELEAENEALESHCNNVEYTARAARDLDPRRIAELEAKLLAAGKEYELLKARYERSEGQADAFADTIQRMAAAAGVGRDTARTDGADAREVVEYWKAQNADHERHVRLLERRIQILTDGISL